MKSNLEPKVQFLDARGNPLAMDTAHFAASREARELKNWTPALQSADAELAGEIEPIAARAYDLERNNGIAGGATRTITDNVAGPGFRLSARPDYRAMGRTKEWADAWARNTEAKWRTFANSRDFDAARHLTFGGMTVMQYRTCMLAGDAVALPLWITDRPGVKWNTAIQAIDPARLRNPAGIPTTNIRSGVELAPTGEAIAYHIRKSHPGDGYSLGMFDDPSFERIPARTSFGRLRVIHLFEKLRPGQSRGKSIFTNVMASFRMLDHYQRTELQTVVVNSMISAFIETPLDGQAIAELFGSDEKYIASRNEWEVKLAGGSIIPLHPGDKLNAFTPSRPNSAYSQFVEAVLRYIGTGLNLPYELLLKDFSKSNYSSARAALLEAWRYFLGQREFLATYWCDPIYELWLEEAISKGEVEAPDFYEHRAAYCACKWVGPGRGWIDPLKEAQAADTRLKAGISTLEREAMEQGDDWEEVLEQRARETALALSLGQADPHAPPPQGGTAPGAGPAEDPADPEAPPGQPPGRDNPGARVQYPYPAEPDQPEETR